MASYELWKSWCALQVQTYAYLSPFGPFGTSSPPPYTCLPETVSYAQQGSITQCAMPGDDGGTVAVDCGKDALCNGLLVCTCNATSCTSDPTHDVLFDMQLSGDHLDGSSGEVSVRLWLYSPASAGGIETPVVAHFVRSH